jgi:hypothetical protein
VYRAFTKYTSKSASCKTSYKAIQYTPVDCSATLVIPHFFSHGHHLLQAFRTTVKGLHWLCISIGRHGHIVRVLAYVNASSISMDYLQCHVVRLDLSCQFVSLFSAQLTATRRNGSGER